MKMRIKLGAAFILVIARGAAQGGCPDVSDVERKRLIEYVQAKFRVSSATSLVLSKISPLDDTCYRRLRFTSSSNANLKIEVVASPDLRFLTRELMDSRLDPLREEAQKASEVAAELDHGAFPVLGPATAPVTITIFSDFQCPFCAQAKEVLMKEILPNETGVVRLAFRNFPLPMHPWAMAAAQAAACAQEQGDEFFWRFHDYLFDHQNEVTTANLQSKLEANSVAAKGFDIKEFRGCLEGKKTADTVERDLALGRDLGVNGTPTLFINGRRLSGAQAEQIRTYIREIASGVNR